MHKPIHIPGLDRVFKRALTTGDKTVSKKDIDRAITASFDQHAFKNQSDRVELRNYLRGLKEDFNYVGKSDGKAGISQADLDKDLQPLSSIIIEG